MAWEILHDARVLQNSETGEIGIQCGRGDAVVTVLCVDPSSDNVNAKCCTEDWKFTLADGSEVTKKVVLLND